MEFFCVFCGIKTVGNAEFKAMYDLFCPTCQGFISFSIIKRPSKTDEEVEKAFQDTPLTDSQRGTKRFSSRNNKA